MSTVVSGQSTPAPTYSARRPSRANFALGMLRWKRDPASVSCTITCEHEGPHGEVPTTFASHTHMANTRRMADDLLQSVSDHMGEWIKAKIDNKKTPTEYTSPNRVVPDPEVGHVSVPSVSWQTALTMHQLAAELKRKVQEECSEVGRRTSGAAVWSCSGADDNDVEDGTVVFERGLNVDTSEIADWSTERVADVDINPEPDVVARRAYQFDISSKTERRTGA